MRKLKFNALPFIMLLAIVARMPSLGQSLWLDEATTALVSKMPIVDIFSKFLPGDFHPPLYYLLMRMWVYLFGNSEIALRIPSVIFGIGIVYVTYLIGKKAFNTKIAKVASLIAATSGILIYYSQEARMYSLAALLVLAIFYFFLNRKWFLFSIFLAVLGMTDYVALLILPVFVVFGRKDLKKVFLSMIPMAVVFGAWMPIFIKQISGGLSNSGGVWWKILGAFSIKSIALIPVKFMLGRISFDNNLVYIFIAIVSLLIFCIPVTIGIKKAITERQNIHSLKVVAGWFILPIMAGILISIKIPVLYYFRFLFCVPAFYLIVSAGLGNLRRNTFRAALFGVLIINIISSGMYLFMYKFQREDWRLAADTMNKGQIIMPGNAHEEALLYYGKAGQIMDINSLSGLEEKIWLSRYVWEIADPENNGVSKIESLGYSKIREYDFNGVVFWEYSKNLYAHLN